MVLHDFLKDLFAEAELSAHIAINKMSKLVLNSSHYVKEAQLYSLKKIKNLKWS